MSEISDAWAVIHDRHMASQDGDPRHLLVGMDLGPEELEDLQLAAIEFAEAATGRPITHPHTLDVAGAWADGFTVGAMVFLRRAER